MADFRPEVDAMVSDLLRGWQPGEPFEVMRNLAQPLAITAVLAFLGVPPNALATVREWSGAIMAARSGEATGEGAWRAARKAREDLERYLRGERPGGVIEVLMEAEAEGQITFDELVVLLIHISFAGNAPTSFAMGNALLALSSHPQEFERLRKDPALAQAAVEEVLRFDTPTHVVHRFVSSPTELGGRKMRAGETVAIVLGAANRDPAKFPRPGVFDIGREVTGQLAFGQGIHFCLGAPLARLELAALLEAVVTRFSRLHVVPGGLQRGDTFLLRGPRLLAL
ncbi:MAG TPA: cytochrome P450, partial [Tepidiformaceae bacterium]|nr:cytochrome P450 [Tepidiformaceae bacterium]